MFVYILEFNFTQPCLKRYDGKMNQKFMISLRKQRKDQILRTLRLNRIEPCTALFKDDDLDQFEVKPLSLSNFHQKQNIDLKQEIEQLLTYSKSRQYTRLDKILQRIRYRLRQINESDIDIRTQNRMINKLTQIIVDPYQSVSIKDSLNIVESLLQLTKASYNNSNYDKVNQNILWLLCNLLIDDVSTQSYLLQNFEILGLFKIYLSMEKYRHDHIWMQVISWLLSLLSKKFALKNQLAFMEIQQFVFLALKERRLNSDVYHSLTLFINNLVCNIEYATLKHMICENQPLLVNLLYYIDSKESFFNNQLFFALMSCIYQLLKAIKTPDEYHSFIMINLVNKDVIQKIALRWTQLIASEPNHHQHRNLAKTMHYLVRKSKGQFKLPIFNLILDNQSIISIFTQLLLNPNQKLSHYPFQFQSEIMLISRKMHFQDDRHLDNYLERSNIIDVLTNMISQYQVISSTQLYQALDFIVYFNELYPQESTQILQNNTILIDSLLIIQSLANNQDCTQLANKLLDQLSQCDSQDVDQSSIDSQIFMI
ncbi:UNKNOWN [Stylonychia lemnae]|uniref:Uncharacterized protein n=1 Tax=Stylonychia lemnae TaxID=5949 RepID=A0A078BCU3_STYLE|nr:UNKNOWN [Stylonychia lemnae]|eukprot:CDW91408.1 UNKNOWN [Stylonychia lemnae]